MHYFQFISIYRHFSFQFLLLRSSLHTSLWGREDYSCFTVFGFFIHTGTLHWTERFVDRQFEATFSCAFYIIIAQTTNCSRSCSDSIEKTVCFLVVTDNNGNSLLLSWISNRLFAMFDVVRPGLQQDADVMHYV